MALLYMFRVIVSPIIRSTMLYMATGKLAHTTHRNTLLLAPFCKKHGAEQQDRDYLQLHNNRTTLLLTNLIIT